MKETPLLMKDQMVVATLDDMKTQTRRVNGLDYINKKSNPDDWRIGTPEEWKAPTENRPAIGGYPKEPYHIFRNVHTGRMVAIPCPYGKAGDRLWVREAWRITGGFADTPIRELSPAYGNNLQFRADRDESYIDKYHPSIFMPRWACRLRLDLLDVRVQRIQEIDELDIQAEGISPFSATYYDEDGGKDFDPDEYRGHFQELWNSINAKRGYGWNVNPWVWVLVFRRIEKEAT